MGLWKSCPECGATNHYEESGSQFFDCGFQGDSDGETREARCEAVDHSEGGPGSSDVQDASGVARYRLAFLDAAKALDGIAQTMAEGGGDVSHAAACRELVEQMRAFAGHGQGSRPGFAELTGLGEEAADDDPRGESPPPQSKGGLPQWMRRLRPK